MQQKTEPKRVRSLSFGIERLGDNLLERKSINALRELIIDLQFVDGMAGEVSLFSAREAPEPGKIPGPALSRRTAQGRRLQAAHRQGP